MHTPWYLADMHPLAFYPYGSFSFWVVFHLGHLPFGSSSIGVIFHWGHLPFWLSSIWGWLILTQFNYNCTLKLSLAKTYLNLNLHFLKVRLGLLCTVQLWPCQDHIKLVLSNTKGCTNTITYYSTGFLITCVKRNWKAWPKHKVQSPSAKAKPWAKAFH